MSLDEYYLGEQICWTVFFFMRTDFIFVNRFVEQIFYVNSEQIFFVNVSNQTDQTD